MISGTTLSMRKILPITLFAAAAAFAANTALAQADSAPISSASEGALEAPEDWDCDRYQDEWSDWIEAGNAPAAWRFSGNTYRAASDGDLYTWADWLDWAEDNGCLAGAYLQPDAGGGFGSTTAIGLVAGFFATGLIAASGGENAKSPG